MHEASLIENLLKQVTELAAEHHSQTVSEVRLEIGLLSNVEPILLKEAFDRQKVGSSAANAELVIDDVGLRCRCRSCSTEFLTGELKFHCETCGSRDISVIGGDEVLLVSATLTKLSL